MLESGEGMTIYNPQRVTRQFRYDQGAVTLISELSTSNGLVAKARFLALGISRIWRVEKSCSSLG